MRRLSTRELAEVLGVSESSLKRWVDAGRIQASRTDGGHRRIQLAEAMRFIRATGIPIVRPELLDLPELAAAEGTRLVDHLLEGDGVGARGWLLSRYLAGETIAELADGPIREAMRDLGELWRYRDNGVYIEHRGMDACIEAIAHLRAIISVNPRAPKAVGGGPAGDPYLLPTQLAAMTVADAGLRPINLGPDTPTSAFAAAIAEQHPRLLWISISAALAPARAGALTRWLATLPASLTVVVGGQQASGVSLPPRVVRGTTMRDLAAVAAGLCDGAGTR